MQNALLNAKTLLEKRDLIEKKKNRKINIEVKDVGTFKFRIPTTLDIVDAKAFENGERDEQYMIYTCCESPQLNDEELLKGFNCEDDPYSLIDKIFLPGEVTSIASKLIQESGYKEEYVKVVDDIKN